MALGTRRSSRRSTVASTLSSQTTPKRTRSSSRSEASSNDESSNSQDDINTEKAVVDDTPSEETTDVPSEDKAEPSSQKPVDHESSQETDNEPSQETIDELEPSQEAVNEPSQEADDELSQETIDEPSQETMDEPSQEMMDELSQETTNEPSQKTRDEPSQGKMEETSEETINEPSEEVDNRPSEDIADRPIEIADRSERIEETSEDIADKPSVEMRTEVKFHVNSHVTENKENTELVSSEQTGKKKKKKKRKKRAKNQQRSEFGHTEEEKEEEEDIEIEYISEKIELPKWDPNYAAFSKIFEAFKIEEKLVKEEKVDDTPEKPVEVVKEPIDPLLNDDDDDDDDDARDGDKDKNDEKKLSKKQLKKQNRMEVATLKQVVTRPDVVEMHDVNSKDPQLLVYLKSYKNTVPVPRHWCFKRKYLAGKRGFVKPPFELPEFIKQTGIMEMRAAMQEKEDTKTLKSKQRGKVRPKLGKIDIDYQKLHDAFFKYQTKPKMTIHGDLYYEGKEFEIRLKEKKPGDLTDDLRTALGMPVDQGKELIPPPWLIAMQRYGPPPSYPNLKIPGLNAAIPDGASFGYHAGGWGKPPVDERGKPLYGDVFGTQLEDTTTQDDEEGGDKVPWGELESESESEEESEEEEEEEDQTGLVTPGDAGLVTPSGISSVATAGIETPDMIELRKRKEIEDAMETGGDTPALYTVLQEKRTTVGASMMGSAHTYDVVSGRKGEGVEITLDPSELELEPAAMAAKYDDTMKEREAASNREDFSDMVAEHAAKKKRKKPTDSGKAAKKYKEFKF